jgi:aldose 1-epimerase
MGTLERWIIRHESGTELEILSGWGGGLNAWRVHDAKGQLQNLLYGYQDEETFRKIQADTSAGVRLSPFPGRTRNAEWTWNGERYSLDNNVTWAPHALHGLLHVKPWKVESFSSDDMRAALVLARDWYGEHPGFPFPYRATTTFFFTKNTFSILSETENCGKTAMPYAEGWHPYFSLGLPVDELSLLLPPVKKVLVDKADIPTGIFVPDSRFTAGHLIKDEFINDCFVLENQGKMAVTELSSPENLHKISVWQHSGNEQWNCIQIYTPPDRKSLAIEPMTAEPDVLNHHRGLIEIPAGEKIELRWGAQYTSESEN